MLITAIVAYSEHRTDRCVLQVSQYWQPAAAPPILVLAAARLPAAARSGFDFISSSLILQVSFCHLYHETIAPALLLAPNREYCLVTGNLW
mmetsp:Transcript_2062/g.2436  ORF Transcript_2062/g.2436 Transcript_2062/m.2436 type:complete len:91 (-) Transcript_2062:31-303(-)